MKNTKVAVVMGSDSDMPTMKKALDVLREFKVNYEVRIISAHRTPKETKEFAGEAAENGFGVIIAGAGGAAHLAGVIAGLTILPVIGVPVETKSLKGLDSLLSTVQMPSGIPVGCVAIGAAKNAALLSVEILALGDERLRRSLSVYRRKMRRAVLGRDKKVRLLTKNKK